MQILNVNIFGDFDMQVSLGYFKSENNHDLNELNKEFILKISKKNHSSEQMYLSNPYSE